MDDIVRWVNLSFVFACLLLWWVFANLTFSIYELVGRTDKQILGENLTETSVVGLVVALIITIFMRRNAGIYESGLNIARELKKVTWPDWEDTKGATKTTIITTLIISGILAIFDFGFEKLTAFILGIES